MSRKKVCVVGHFGFGLNMLNGQTVKTKNVTAELERVFGENEVKKIDTHGGIKAFPIILFKLIGAFITCDNICIFPAHNGVKVFVPLCVFLKSLFKRKVHYIVIGGWLPSYIEDNPKLENKLKKLNGIYVETSVMKRQLNLKQFRNVILFPNFKRIDILDEEQLVYSYNEPYKLCTFSRVMREKGIEDAINVVRQINENEGRVIYTLDIYGQVDSEQIDWFDNLQKEFPAYISYKGLVDSDKSVDVLKKYYLLLFPTRFYTEGIPGTILDAYAAGVPVVSSQWESFKDVVNDNYNGLSFKFMDCEDFKKVLTMAFLKKNNMFEMKNNCIITAKEYLPKSIIAILTKCFE